MATLKELVTMLKTDKQARRDVYAAAVLTVFLYALAVVGLCL